MRLKISLQTRDKLYPLNANYYLSSAIYKLLQLGSVEFASFLHNKGYELNGKRYKLFSFAMKFEKTKFFNNNINIILPGAELWITSPLIEDFMQNFITGSFEKQEFEISDGIKNTKFAITGIEVVPEPEITGTVYIRLLSPLVLSKKIFRNGKEVQYYLRYNDDINEINNLLNKNLINKYFIIKKKEYEGPGAELKWDNEYIESRKEQHRLTKKISVKKEGINPVEIIANEVPFTLSGDTDLIRTGYQCGFGEKNSMGFGMGEIRKKEFYN